MIESGTPLDGETITVHAALEVNGPSRQATPGAADPLTRGPLF